MHMNPERHKVKVKLIFRVLRRLRDAMVMMCSVQGSGGAVVGGGPGGGGWVLPKTFFY
jgi:hypothetical protein